jgi:hypothetical protein
VLVVCAVIALVVIDPGKPEPVCRYASQKVTVEITGPNCMPIMRMVTDDTDRTWISTGKARGEQFSQLYKGKNLVRIYEAGNKPFAGILSDFFQARQWIVEAPSPAPA